MNRRIVLIVSLVLLLGVIALVIRTSDKGGNKITVSYVNSETSHGEFPSYRLSQRLAFAVRNDGPKAGPIVVSGIENQHGNWVAVFPPLVLGDVEAGKATQLYLYLPPGSHPRSLRMRVYENASTFQKTLYAMRLLIKKASGRYPNKQIWFNGLKQPAGELTVKLDKEAEPESAANSDQPIRSETNQTSSAAGHRR